MNATTEDAASVTAALPEAGSDLLSFKRQASERRSATDVEAFGGGGNAAILDDPAQRLAEFDGFEELVDDVSEDERLAVLQVVDASLVRTKLANLTSEESELAPYLAAMQHILHQDVQEPELPVIVLPHLLLGDYGAARDAEKLQSLGVTHVVNCADASARGPVEHAALGIDYLCLHAEDHLSYEILQHRHQVADVVRRCRDSGGVCLVHCAAGINRSGGARRGT